MYKRYFAPEGDAANNTSVRRINEMANRYQLSEDDFKNMSEAEVNEYVRNNTRVHESKKHRRESRAAREEGEDLDMFISGSEDESGESEDEQDCPEGMERHPNTRRCVKVCPDGKERNTKGNCVPLCRQGMMRNPITGRCIKLEGAVAKRVLRTVEEQQQGFTDLNASGSDSEGEEQSGGNVLSVSDSEGEEQSGINDLSVSDIELIEQMMACGPTRMRNPATKRCVKRDGAIGRRLLKGDSLRANAVEMDQYISDKKSKWKQMKQRRQDAR